MKTAPTLITAGVMANVIGEPLHRIQYILRTREHIRPSAFAGRLRLYDHAALGKVRQELRAIDKRVSRPTGTEVDRG